jgi:hypothetical protein
MAVLICDAVMLIVVFDAVVRRPCASTVKLPTVLALP